MLGLCRVLAGALAVTVLLAACQRDEAEPAAPVTGSYAPDAAARAEAQCREDGGSWGKAGAAGGQVCTRPTADANQPCRSGSECDGLCLARSRTCAPVKPFFGCHDILTDRGVEATLCID
ncbi:hypothetical protein SAMN04490244_11428 [Tranquillimonas rosea]|uniref:Secreted protein n=1 Tax=Tranquillimonas rosea TaxID=641238 RepID=A0A1H9WX74_9RHOB|nr:hypothetical protein [Tranquillimonas rosea]SES38434.1 hypothetical protein SAMN04490244_11428 [Tranquillimonas rosea]